MKLNIFLRSGIFMLASYLSVSCEDFVEIDAPGDKLVREMVFNSNETAESAMTGIYNELHRTSFCNGSKSSITVLGSLSADLVKNISSSNLPRLQFEQNEILPDNGSNFDLWASAYKVIYLTNSLLEGLEDSEGIDPGLKSQLTGEGKFIRAFSYFYLTNLYGNVPLLLTTEYSTNALASRESQALVYSQILDDLHSAVELLDSEYRGGERTTVNSSVAKALLARVYLYLEDWESAETFSSQVIDEASDYEILDDMDLVFKANSREALWQISPIGGGGPSTYTYDGNSFIIHPDYPNFAIVQLREDFIPAFDTEDLRLTNWIGFSPAKNAYYPFKYKIWNTNDLPIEEYSMVLRFAEQYLIRAEARAQMGSMEGAIADIDVIKNRAGIDLISETNADISTGELLKEIYEERKKELFSEWGHRWFDINRTNRTGEIFATSNPLWEETDRHYPIPEEERVKNPNLTQNPGY